jgi:hypothetical protein
VDGFRNHTEIVTVENRTDRCEHGHQELQSYVSRSNK